MAEKESGPVIKEDTKEAKQLKKQQEKLQKEWDKREKKLEKERKKQEERERKQREREEKALQRAQQQATKQKPLSSGDDGVKSNGTVEQHLSATENDPTKQSITATEEPKKEAAIAQEQHKDDLANAQQLPNEAESTTKTPPAAVTDEQIEPAEKEASWPEKVTVAEPPGQITGCGMPIGIVFNTAQAGQGSLTASCIGTKAAEVPVDVTDLGKGMISVKMTPNIADIYTMNVKWAGKVITGSPFTINLSLLPPAREEAQPEQQRQEEPKMMNDNKQKEQEDEEVEVEEISDDPFEMAFQASRMLEEQRQKALSSKQGTPQTNHVAINNESPQTNHNQPKDTSPPPTATNIVSATTPPKSISMPVQTSTPAIAVEASLYHSTSPSPEPFSPASPVEEDTLSLQEANKALQETNVGLSGEVAHLKKKMGEFEAKLTDIEESNRRAEEERQELMTQTSMRGWLFKRGIKGPTANVWRRRYFRCDQGCKIHYYRASNEAVPRGTIDVEMIESVGEVAHDPQTSTAESTERFGFNITCIGRTYELQSEDDETRKQWISTIQYLKDWHQKNKTGLLSTSKLT